MNFLAVILALLIAALPMQAGACVPTGADAPQAAAAADADGGDGHDCCPDESTDTPETGTPCSGGGHCGHCVVPGSALLSEFAPMPFLPPEFAFTAVADTVPPSHDQPLYRPPIA